MKTPIVPIEVVMYLHAKAVLAIGEFSDKTIDELNSQYLSILEATGWDEKDYEHLLLNRINSEWD